MSTADAEYTQAGIKVIADALHPIWSLRGRAATAQLFEDTPEDWWTGMEQIKEGENYLGLSSGNVALKKISDTYGDSMITDQTKHERKVTKAKQAALDDYVSTQRNLALGEKLLAPSEGKLTREQVALEAWAAADHRGHGELPKEDPAVVATRLKGMENIPTRDMLQRMTAAPPSGGINLASSDRLPPLPKGGAPKFMEQMPGSSGGGKRKRKYKKRKSSTKRKSSKKRRSKKRKSKKKKTRRRR